ncbi:hypothetical protein AMS68_003047 [Peltaster fructicola]|uniref:Zn(2)-C6 fungal-type domain-containing protein n=1 Tax=Peltaster fructicola TaxID=286661 RepID=A0A6H0XST9_9PEZI|nr:hypothetical protein AMS68_003047 [Peltaster fructicola]
MSPSLAAQACSACRKQKRRCDKQLPACTLCIRIGRDCKYLHEQARDPEVSSSAEFEALRQRVIDLESVIATSSARADGVPENGTPRPHATKDSLSAAMGDRVAVAGSWPTRSGQQQFPSLFFLDALIFGYAGNQIPSPYVKVPVDGTACLGTSVELRTTTEEYFTTVHSYFPIISKIRLFQHLSNPLHEPGADYLLLFMAIKLITAEVPSDVAAAQLSAYRDVKALYSYIESRNGFTMQTLQALLLIALFEIGHSIWPAAYLTTGGCARLGHAMGVHSRHATSMLPRTTTWTEQEERRRVAWGIFILDRYANVGHHNKPFATDDPGLDVHLPTDDGAWDRGQMGAAAPLSLSASQSTSVSSYARLCQATHMLSKVIRHTNDRSMPEDYLSSEALQLDVTVRALLDAMQDELSVMDDDKIGTFISAVSVCISAAMTLYDKYSCSTTFEDTTVSESRLHVHKRSIDGLAEVTDRSFQLAKRLKIYIAAYGIRKVSPFVLDSLYSAAATYAWYVRESSDAACGERLDELKELMSIIDGRWRSAGEYVRIVDSTESYINGDRR